MDIKPILNEHKAIIFVCLFEQIRGNLLSSNEACCSRINWEKICPVPHAYASNRECSVQEAVCHCLQELWKIFPGVIYANTTLAEKRWKMLQSHEGISQLPDESEDI